IVFIIFAVLGMSQKAAERARDNAEFEKLRKDMEELTKQVADRSRQPKSPKEEIEELIGQAPQYGKGIAGLAFSSDSSTLMACRVLPAGETLYPGRVEIELWRLEGNHFVQHTDVWGCDAKPDGIKVAFSAEGNAVALVVDRNVAVRDAAGARSI